MPARRVCPTPGCPRLIDKGQRRCPDCAGKHEQQRGTRQERGYTAEHDALRARWAPIVATGTVHCARCGDPIRPDQPWALDHTDDRSAYRGPSHSLCNNRAGGQAAHHN